MGRKIMTGSRASPLTGERSPDWREEDQPQGTRKHGGPDQTHHQNPHPAFADAAQMAQAAHAAYVRFQQSRSPQARATQMNQQGQSSAPYSQGMDQTLFRSQLHQHPQYEQPQQHSQQPQTQVQQQYRQQAQQKSLRLPQPQPHNQAKYQVQQQAREQVELQAREQAQQQAREKAEQHVREQAELRAREQAQRDAQRQAEIQAREQTQKEAREQAQQQARRQAELQAQQQAEKFALYQAQKRLQEQAQQAQQYAQQQPLHPPFQDHRGQLQQYYRETQLQDQHQHQAQSQANSRPQQDRPQPPLQQYQYQEVPNKQQYVRPSDIDPPGSYYRSNSINGPYTPLAQVRSPVLTQKQPSGPNNLAQPSPTTSQSPDGAHSRLPTGGPPQTAYTAPNSHSSDQQSPSSAAPPNEPPRSNPSSQRNSTRQNTQEKGPEIRPQTPPRAPSQPQGSPKQPEASRQGSFLEDAALFRTKSPKEDPYTSSSRSTLGPRANLSNMPASTATASASTRPPAASHSHPSPKPITSAARPASLSVAPSPTPSACAPVTAPGQLRTSGSPPIMSPTPAAAATDRPSIGKPATFACMRSPAVPPVKYAVPQALRTYATPQMLKAYAATQAQKAPASSQPPAQSNRSISAPSVPSVTSKPTIPAARPPMAKATAPPSTSAQTARSMPAASASPILAAPAVPQTHNATIPPQTTTPIARSNSASSAPPDNFTPFRPASNPRTISGASVPGPKPVAAYSTSTSGRNSPLSSQNTLAGPPRKRGRPPIYPDVVGPVNHPAGPGRAGDRWKVSSPTHLPPNAIPSGYQPVLSGLPVPRDSASASASAPARSSAPPSWKPHANSSYPGSGSTPPLVNRFEPASSQFAVDARAISRTLPPTRAYYTSGPVQSRPASTQPPAAKMRKLDDSSSQPVTPPSGTLDLGQYVRQSPSRKHITYRSDIVEPMNSSDGLLQLEYNPATIARDILIVADKHPTEKGLNHHLHSLRQNFHAVDYSSDLATFRWDIVDPFVNYPPSVLQSVANAQQTSGSLVTRLETISRPPNLSPNFPGPATAEYGMSRVPARDVPTAPLARRAESRPVYNTNMGITTAATTSPGMTNSSLTGSNLNSSGVVGPGTTSSRPFSPGKIGADVTSTGVTKTSIGPSYPTSSPALASTSTSTSTPTSPPKSTSKPAPTPPSAVNLNAFKALPFQPPSYYSPRRPTAQPLPYSLPSLPPPSSAPNVNHSSISSVITETQSSVSAPGSVAVSDQPPQSLPRKSVKSAPGPTSSSKSSASRPPSKRPQPPSQSPRGKVPRQLPLPKGLPEPQVLLPEPQVLIPISPQKMAPPKKKPGRPSQKDVQVEVAIDNRPATQYQVFKCKWTGCEAELHNLEAIYAHILGIHIPHHIVCAWDGCTDKNPRAAADMWEHVRDKHMTPLAWQLGDGPSASITAADSYEQLELSGQGRQDTMTLPADRDSVKIFSRIHGTQMSKQKAELMEDGGRRWKEDAGPDMDTSDRALSTPPRLMASSHTETAYTMSEVSVVI